jgi:NAD(P)H-flavin reductase
MEVYELTVVEIIEQTPTVKTIRFRPDRKIDFKPGQFLMYHILSRRVAYSIASAPYEEYIDLCVTKVGEASGFLHELKIGDKIKADGPHGVFTLEPESDNLVFIATGSGIAPIRSMIHSLINKGTDKKITLIFGVRNMDCALFKDEFERMDINFIPVCSREGKKQHVQDVIKEMDFPDAEFYICGIMDMVSDVKKVLIDKGIPAGKIHHEMYV